MKEAVSAFVSAFVIPNITWWGCAALKIGIWKKIVCRRKSESQTDPDKQVQPDKEHDCGFAYAVLKKQGFR